MSHMMLSGLPWLVVLLRLKIQSDTIKFFCFASTQFVFQPFTQIVKAAEKQEYCDFCHLDSCNDVLPNGPLPYICPVPQCKNRVHSITTGKCIDCNNKMVDFYNPELKACTGCKMVYYCSSPCQKAAWKSYHDKECRFLKNWAKNHGPPSPYSHPHSYLDYPKGELFKNISFSTIFYLNEQRYDEIFGFWCISSNVPYFYK